ncbi:MAG: hypothetical protein E6I87_14865 [Chloroflexi bacterium]|nr:MAG: hypothetical protein E6I87_14865 [Chloroflexota bacterium]
MNAKRVDVQIRGMPAGLRDRLRRRSDRKGVSMSQYVIEVLKDDLSRPTLDEWWEEVRKQPPLNLRTPAADAIRAARREEGVED